MSNARRILDALDARLDGSVELTLYGRAALQLGFHRPLDEFALSKDVDGVLWTGQAEALAADTRFWEAVEEINHEMAAEGLYISHFFTEEQVVLRPCWREARRPIPGDWLHLDLYRLGDEDLLLSKLMRDDPIDRADARFIVSRTGLTREAILDAIRDARVPEIEEIQEQFALCSQALLRQLDGSPAL